MKNLKFKIARIKAGRTQLDLSNLTGIPKSRIVRFETGRLNIAESEADLLALAMALNVKPRELHG